MTAKPDYGIICTVITELIRLDPNIDDALIFCGQGVIFHSFFGGIHLDDLENREQLQTETAEASARQSTEYMGTEKVTKLLIKFGLPAIATILVNAMYNMVDRIFVSNGVGYIGLSAISISSPITYVMAALAMLIGVGGHTIFAMRLGEKDYDGAEEVLGNTFAAMIAMCILKFVVAFTLLAPILRVLGASGEMLTYGEQYMRIILCGTFFSAISYGMNNFVNTSGNPMMGMTNLIVGCVVNIVFDALFILVFHWGVRGAALATIMGQFASAFMVISYFTFSKKPPVHFRWKQIRIRWALTFKEIFGDDFYLEIQDHGLADGLVHLPVACHERLACHMQPPIVRRRRLPRLLPIESALRYASGRSRPNPKRPL